MRSVLFSSLFFLSVFLQCLPAFADAANFQLAFGHREDSFNWNIAGDGNGESPNILSELTWSDLRMAELEVGLDMPLAKWRRRNLFLHGGVSYGWINEGENQDSDFFANDRQQEWSRSNNRADDGNALELALGIVFVMKSPNGRWRVTPGFGYSYRELNLVIQDGRQTIPERGSIPGLDSAYDARWNDIWVEAKADYAFSQRIHFGGAIRYQGSHYVADGDWNLRSDLQHPVSFRHRTYGQGLSLRLAANYELTRNSKVSLGIEQASWRSAPGTNTVYAATGEVGSVQLNEVDWSSRVVRLDLQTAF